MNPWGFGVLLLAAWAALVYGLSYSKLRKPVQVLSCATALTLAVVLWDHTARQPRIRLDAVQLRKLPSSAQPGLIELVVRNTGAAAAAIVVFPVAHLAPPFRNARDLIAANVEADLKQRLKQAMPLPADGTIVVEDGRSAVLSVGLPFSERVWLIARGELTVLVAARIQFRDRVFQREKLVCQFANPQSGQWTQCPFLNN